jgi:hypothetical protein
MARDVHVGETFVTPGGFKYRVIRHGKSGVLVREVSAKRVTTINTEGGETVTFTSDASAIVIGNETEVGAILGAIDAPAPVRRSRTPAHIVDDSDA